MEGEKPRLDSYSIWASSHLGEEHGKPCRERYDSNVKRACEFIQQSPLWQELQRRLGEQDSAEQIRTGRRLFHERSDKLVTKSFDSVLNKCWRWNYKLNKDWPAPPAGGWIKPSNWYGKIPDLVRTRLVTSFLDGVLVVEKALQEFATERNLTFKIQRKANEDGYHAIHCRLFMPAEILRGDWTSETIHFSVEVQVTTRLKEVIGTLLHSVYEVERAADMPEDADWHWDFASRTFKTNYLGHVMHYLDGMIVEAREHERNDK